MPKKLKLSNLKVTSFMTSDSLNKARGGQPTVGGPCGSGVPDVCDPTDLCVTEYFTEDCCVQNSTEIETHC